MKKLIAALAIAMMALPSTAAAQKGKTYPADGPPPSVGGKVDCGSRSPERPRTAEVQEAWSQLAERMYGNHWDALYNLWTCEANFNPKARGGIPQFRPDRNAHTWSADRQISAGLDYIFGRYKTPTKAWTHFQNLNWY